MTAPKPSKVTMRKDLKAKDALLHEQEITIDHLRTENMDLKARLTQKRKATQQKAANGR